MRLRGQFDRQERTTMFKKIHEDLQEGVNGSTGM
jgi:hypothetical protein